MIGLIFLGKEKPSYVNLDEAIRNEVSLIPGNIPNNIFISKNDSLKDVNYKDVFEQKESNLDIFNDSILNTTTEIEKNPVLPFYKVERLEEVSKAFGQIKIFATVKK